MIVIYHSDTEYSLFTIEEYLNSDRNAPAGEYIMVSIL